MGLSSVDALFIALPPVAATKEKMSNTLQYSDPDTMISQMGKNASGVYQIDPATQKAFSATNQDNIALVPSGTYTTNQLGTDQTNINGRGVVVVLDMTTVGTGSVTLEIDGKDPVSGKYYAILTGSAVTTNSTNVYRVYPGLTAVANATANDVLPRTWKVKVTANNSNVCTYSVGAMVVL